MEIKTPKTKEGNVLISVIIVIVAIIAVYFVLKNKHAVAPTDVNQPNQSTVGDASTGDEFDNSITDDTVKLSYNSKNWGVATNSEQILVHTYIPPCDSNFSYCLYYIGSAYQGTNFESSGIRTLLRSDLSNERLCLNTPPQGFSATTVPKTTLSKDAYASSVFSNVGDAAMGHYASGSLYRLFTRSNNSCYEFETRIGETQYANYPAGTIKEFTVGDRGIMKAMLNQIISEISLSDGTKNLWQ